MLIENNKNSFIRKMCKNSSSKLLNQSVDHFMIGKLTKQQLCNKTYLEFKGELGYGSWGIPLLVNYNLFNSNVNITWMYSFSVTRY